MSLCAGWRECIGVKSQFRNHEGLVRKLLEDAREPHYQGFCTGMALYYILKYILYEAQFSPVGNSSLRFIALVFSSPLLCVVSIL